MWGAFSDFRGLPCSLFNPTSDVRLFLYRKITVEEIHRANHPDGTDRSRGHFFYPEGYPWLLQQQSFGYRIMAFSMRTHHCRISFLSDTFIAVATL